MFDSEYKYAGARVKLNVVTNSNNDSKIPFNFNDPMAKLIQIGGEPKYCESCESEELKYIGLGQYECNNCHHVNYDNYGKVRTYLDSIQGSASFVEVQQETGLSKIELQNLIERGSISLVNNGKLLSY